MSSLASMGYHAINNELRGYVSFLQKQSANPAYFKSSNPEELGRQLKELNDLYAHSRLQGYEVTKYFSEVHNLRDLFEKHIHNRQIDAKVEGLERAFGPASAVRAVDYQKQDESDRKNALARANKKLDELRGRENEVARKAAQLFDNPNVPGRFKSQLKTLRAMRAQNIPNYDYHTILDESVGDELRHYFDERERVLALDEKEFAKLESEIMPYVQEADVEPGQVEGEEGQDEGEEGVPSAAAVAAIAQNEPMLIVSKAPKFLQADEKELAKFNEAIKYILNLEQKLDQLVHTGVISFQTAQTEKRKVWDIVRAIHHAKNEAEPLMRASLVIHVLQKELSSLKHFIRREQDKAELRQKEQVKASNQAQHQALAKQSAETEAAVAHVRRFADASPAPTAADQYLENLKKQIGHGEPAPRSSAKQPIKTPARRKDSSPSSDEAPKASRRPTKPSAASSRRKVRDPSSSEEETRPSRSKPSAQKPSRRKERSPSSSEKDTRPSRSKPSAQRPSRRKERSPSSSEKDTRPSRSARPAREAQRPSRPVVEEGRRPVSSARPAREAARPSAQAPKTAAELFQELRAAKKK